MKFCPNCGKEIDMNADFCIHCGKKNEKETTTVDEVNSGKKKFPVWGTVLIVLGSIFVVFIIGLIFLFNFAFKISTLIRDELPNVTKNLSESKTEIKIDEVYKKSSYCSAFYEEECQSTVVPLNDTFLVIKYTIKNVKDYEITIYPTFTLKIDKDIKEYKNIEENESFINIEPGKTYEGTLMFDAKKSEYYKLDYDESSFVDSILLRIEDPSTKE